MTTSITEHLHSLIDRLEEDDAPSMHDYLKSLPKVAYCEKCKCWVNRWHKHWGR